MTAPDPGLVSFDEARTPGPIRPAEEEIYVPPPSAAVAALMPSEPPPEAAAARAQTPREAMPAVPRPSDLRKSSNEAKGRSSWVVVMGVVGGLGLVITGLTLVGGVAAWSWYQSSDDPGEPAEVVAPTEPAPSEVGGIPLEPRVRRGTPPAGPKRPDSP